MLDEKKMQLTPSGAGEIEKVYEQAVEEFLGNLDQAPLANLVGIACGIKWTNDAPTGEPALLALVSQKVDRSALTARQMVPARVGDMQTDVLAIGYPLAGTPLLEMDRPVRSTARIYFPGPDEPTVEQRVSTRVTAQEVSVEALARRQRPARGGYSVGHFRITAGTIATAVYDTLPGDIGIPPRYYILSNNHVLANSNGATLGDPILQPGPYDGGTNPADRIGSLSRFIPIVFEPGTPRALQNNLVDAAIAEVEFHDVDRSVFWTGQVPGWLPRASISVGMRVQKTGRTTSYTLGRITAINATVDVGYGGGRVARFKDQFVTTNMSAGGDSGSLITRADDNAAAGLLFAGSSVATIVNQIENVRSLLRVEVAERKL